MTWYELSTDLICANAELKERLSAAEKERDEAIAYAEQMKAATAAVLKAHRLTIKRPAETMDKIENELEEIRRAAAMAEEAISTEAPAALAHLRQEIRREAMEEAAKECEEIDIANRAGLVSALRCAEAIRGWAEQERTGK